MVKSKPTVGLIVTCYNREQYLVQALESIAAQTYQDWVCLIWDDGSEDKSVEIALRFRNADSRFCLMVGKHQGVSGSLKDAIEYLTKWCNPEYLGWVDSDDMLSASALDQTVAMLDVMPNVGLVYTHHEVIDQAGQVQGLGHRCGISYSRERLLTDFMVHHFRLMRRSLYEAVGGIETTLSVAPEYDLILKLSEVTEILCLPVVLYQYRVHKESISSTCGLEQILSSQIAIENALKRRGDSRKLYVDHHARFRLE